MKTEEAEFIIDCLPKGRTLFYYHRDRYAIDLLRFYVGSGKKVRDVKQSPFGRLLQKPLVKEILANTADTITPEHVHSAWSTNTVAYLLTLATRGRTTKKRWRSYWHQTSRPGINLVLQLNFCQRHNRMYRRLIQPDEDHPFEFTEHPIQQEGKLTMGWARLDIDLDRGQALIEEIQNDWIRNALSKCRWLQQFDVARTSVIDRMMMGAACNLDQLKRYVDQILKPHVSIWDEAILTAAIRFIRRELGIRKIFFHTFESGRQIKRMYGSPPRSLYTTLPRKFCFQLTGERPAFLQMKKKVKSARRKSPVQFFVLDL